MAPFFGKSPTTSYGIFLVENQDIGESDSLSPIMMREEFLRLNDVFTPLKFNMVHLNNQPLILRR